MSTLGQNGKVTLLDVAKATDPSGKIATVVELLNQTNEMLIDIPWIEGNLPTGHRSTVRTGIPSATWRKLYQGVQPVKSTRAQVDDACGMLENRTEIDCALAELNGNSAAFRLSESQAIFEGMNQSMQDGFLYESQATSPERITGLTPRYASLSAGSGANIIDAGGSGSDNTSMWLVVWGENTVHGIYPKGSKAGLQHKDLGEIDAFDGQTPPARFRAYADWYQWKCGLVVRDWRYAVRIANIDLSDLVGQSGTQLSTAATLLMKLMAKAFARIPAMGMGTAVFYANRTVKEMLSIQALDRSQNVLAFMPGLDSFGKVAPGSVNNGTLMFQGVPVRTVDRLLNTETRVT